MPTPITFFVCSSYADLSAERLAVMKAIEGLALAHDAMEFFGARQDAPIDVCLAEVRKCDAIIVIVGHKYGSLLPGQLLSFSEAEYDEAIAHDKPCLVYMRDPAVPVLVKDVEREPHKVERLDVWRLRLQERHTVALYRQAEDLAELVSSDVQRVVRSLQAVSPLLAGSDRESRRLNISLAIDRMVGAALRAGAEQESLLTTVEASINSLIRSLPVSKPTAIFFYSGMDSGRVRSLADSLRQRGLEVWIDTDHVAHSGQWANDMETALDRADCLVFFLSPAFLASPWTLQELEFALARRLQSPSRTTIVPVLLQSVDPPPLLRTYKYLDLSGPSAPTDADRLAETIGAARKYTTAATPNPAIERTSSGKLRLPTAAAHVKR